MLIKSLILSFIIFYLSTLFARNNRIQIILSYRFSVTKVIIPFMIITLLFCYIFPASYYFPHNNGVLGDNYFHLDKALLNPGYIKHHHPLFPLISEIFIRLLLKINVLSAESPTFLEQAYYWSILPISLAVSIAIGLFSFMIYRKGASTFQWIIVFLLLATSYGLWLWGIQSNAIGLAMAVELIGAVLFIFWFQSKNYWRLILFAIAISIGVFVHNGLIYFAIGGVISILIVLITNKNDSVKSKFTQFSVFSMVVIIMATAYYILQAKVNHTYNIGKLFAILSDSNYFGSFGSSNIDYVNNIERNFWAGIYGLIGFYYENKHPYWATSKIDLGMAYENIWVKIIQMGSVFSLLMFLVYFSFWKKISPSRGLYILGLANTIIFLIGFTLRQAGTHYYVLALVPNLVLIIAFVTSNKNSQVSKFSYFLPIVLIIICNLYFNAFTKLSVFEGTNINDHPYYERSNRILQLANGYDAYYFSKIDMAYYPNLALSKYYEEKFRSIEWISEWGNKEQLLYQIINLLGSNNVVFLDESAYDILNGQDNIELKKINNNMYVAQVIVKNNTKELLH